MEYQDYQVKKGQEAIQCLDSFYKENSDFIEEEMQERYGNI